MTQIIRPEQQQKLSTKAAKVASYVPDVKGMVKVEDSARDVLRVKDKATMETNG